MCAGSRSWRQKISLRSPAATTAGDGGSHGGDGNGGSRFMHRDGGSPCGLPAGRQGIRPTDDRASQW
jgi:hypothetical protein